MKGSPDPHDGHIKVLIPPCVSTAADQRRGCPSVTASRQPLEEIIYHVQRGINGISQGCIAGLNIYISSLLTRRSKKQPGLMEPRPFRAPRFTFPKSDKGTKWRDWEVNPTTLPGCGTMLASLQADKWWAIQRSPYKTSQTIGDTPLRTASLCRICIRCEAEVGVAEQAENQFPRRLRQLQGADMKPSNTAAPGRAARQAGAAGIPVQLQSAPYRRATGEWGKTNKELALNKPGMRRLNDSAVY